MKLKQIVFKPAFWDSPFAVKFYSDKFGIDKLNSAISFGIEMILPEEFAFTFSEPDDIFTGNTALNSNFRHKLILANTISELREKLHYILAKLSAFNIFPISEGLIDSATSFSLHFPDQPRIMGIVNVTPDSFSDGGKYFTTEKAVEHAIKLLEEGAEIIDIGGESSRPGSRRISDEEELQRVIPVIEKLITIRPETLVSIDTMKASVAKEALSAGAKIVNDISSGNYDDEIIEICRQFDATYIAMHMLGLPDTMQINPYYDDVVAEIYYYLAGKVKEFKSRGINDIYIDPGIGFGKTVFHNLKILHHLKEFLGIGVPLVIGISRKSFIGKILGLEVEERDNPGMVVDTFARLQGVSVIRTHNVKKTKMALTMISALSNPGAYA